MFPSDNSEVGGVLHITPIVYFHPWEFDTVAEMERGLLNRFIGNYNVADTWQAFTKLLADYRASTMEELLDPREARV